MNFFEKIGYLLTNYYTSIFNGVLWTLLLAIAGTIVGLILGIGLALLRNMKCNPTDKVIIKILKQFLSKLSLIYIEVFRGTPMMVQAMIIYFGGIAIGLKWELMFCAFIIISLNTAAYMAENVRSGINSIEVGQYEAARSLGLSHLKTNNLIILPQALKNSIPTIGNELIVNIKDSSVLNVIGVSELYMAGKIMASTYMTTEAYFIIAFIYLCITVICGFILRYIEKRLNGKIGNKHFTFKTKKEAQTNV